MQRAATARAHRRPAARGARGRSGSRTRSRRRSTSTITAAPWCASACSAIARRGRSASWRASSRVDGAPRARADGRDEDRPRLAVVLGLRDQIRGDPRRVRVVVGDDQHLRRTGDRVDVDLAVDLALRRRDPRVARADDLVDARHGLGAVRERADRLRTAELEHAIDAREPRREHRLRRRARRHHDDLGHAGDLRRDRRHQHARRIARRAARDVEADARERGHPQLEPHAVERDVDIGLDRCRRSWKRGSGCAASSSASRTGPATSAASASQRAARHLVAAGGGLALIEPPRVLGHRLVAAGARTSCEDRRDPRVDVARHPRRPIEERRRLGRTRVEEPEHEHRYSDFFGRFGFALDFGFALGSGFGSSSTSTSPSSLSFAGSTLRSGIFTFLGS